MARELLVQPGMTRPAPRILSASAVAGVLLFTAACSSEDAADDEDRADKTGVATSGAYITRTTPTVDTCGSLKDLPSMELAALTASPDGREFDYIEDDIPIHCELGARDEYDCTLALAGVPGIAQTADLRVQWTSPQRFEGEFMTTFDCDEPGELCDALGAQFPAGLPCKTGGRYIGTLAPADAFAPTPGAYAISVTDPVMTTCDDPFPQTKKIAAALAAGDKPGTLTLEAGDDGPPFTCTTETGGRMSCTQTIDIQTAQVTSSIEATWTAPDRLEGAMAIELACNDGGTACLAGVGIEGTAVPCSTVYEISASPAAGS
jgi:hypothetical protein